jgi:hypothetical protein
MKLAAAALTGPAAGHSAATAAGAAVSTMVASVAAIAMRRDIGESEKRVTATVLLTS